MYILGHHKTILMSHLFQNNRNVSQKDVFTGFGRAQEIRDMMIYLRIRGAIDI